MQLSAKYKRSLFFLLATMMGLAIWAAFAPTGNISASTSTRSPEAPYPMRQVKAPIESLELLVMESFPVQYSVRVVSGVPGGCVKPNGYSMTRNGANIYITVYNLEPVGNVPCTKIYRTHEDNINLGSDFDKETTYIVDVNGEKLAFKNGKEVKPVPSPNPTPDPVTSLAPIESVNIHYNPGKNRSSELEIVAGLPDACYSLKGYSVRRSGDTIRARVTNVRSDKDMLCAQIYRTVTIKTPLDNIKACQVYKIIVNGHRYSVQAISPNIRCAQPPEMGNERVRVAMGETVKTEAGDLALTLLEVTEDSRCPLDVLCIRAGTATIQIRAKLNGVNQGQFSLTLGEGQEEKTAASIGKYTVKIVQLDPYPISTKETPQKDYVATLQVLKS